MTLLEQVKEAGIVGCGRAGFPAYVKLNCTVEYFIVNTTECEPLLRTDRWLMIHKAKETVAAAGMIGDMVQAGKRYIALKETYSEETVSLEAAIKDLGSSVGLYRIKNFYPADNEQIMVCDITDRTVPPSGIPLDVGAVVSNLTTVYSIFNAAQGQPFTDKYLTVIGTVETPCIVRAPLGTPFIECLSLAGGSPLFSYHVIAGGPMMGKCYDMKEAVGLTVTKTASGYITVADDTPLAKQHNISVSVILKRAKMCCIQCFYCTQMCPRYLTGHPVEPHMIMRRLAYAQSPQDVLEDEHVEQAMIRGECGLYETYACPMGFQPCQVNIYIKNLFRQNTYRYQKPSGTFTQLEERNWRKAPSGRTVNRLGVDQYYDYHIDHLMIVESDLMCISLRQHIEAPSVPKVQPGDKVTCGQLIGAIPEQALGANIHASISGTVAQATETGTVISVDRQQYKRNTI